MVCNICIQYQALWCVKMVKPAGMELATNLYSSKLAETMQKIRQKVQEVTLPVFPVMKTMLSFLTSLGMRHHKTLCIETEDMNSVLSCFFHIFVDSGQEGWIGYSDPEKDGSFQWDDGSTGYLHKLFSLWGVL